VLCQKLAPLFSLQFCITAYARTGNA
jgi:hypothetical protein